MAKAIITSDNDAVISETEIAAPPERIFHALTTPEALARWFTNPGCPVKFWKMDARRGVQYSYETQRGTVVVNGADEFECHGEILEIDPPRLLVYTWIGSWHNNKDLRTVVRWELTPQGGGTHVKVMHSVLAQEDVARKDYSGGWPGVVEMLKKFVEQ
jgi:uncharacterized protein YndB with AHSA1/START domain